MMEFEVYFKLGLQHILDLKGYDHILFVLTIAAIYAIKEWKKVFLLVTAFTIGHSVTLALAAFKVVTFNSDLIELLIPITIAITALYTIFFKKKNTAFLYVLILLFGLIHGLGFSNYFSELMVGTDAIVKPLFSFNLGVEAGQLVVVFTALILNLILQTFLKISQRDWILVISGLTLGCAISLILDKI